MLPHGRWSEQKQEPSPAPPQDGSSTAPPPDAPRLPCLPFCPTVLSRHPSPPAAAADPHAALAHTAAVPEPSAVQGRHASTTSSAAAAPGSAPGRATGFSPASATLPVYADEQSADGHPDPPPWAPTALEIAPPSAGEECGRHRAGPSSAYAHNWRGWPLHPRSENGAPSGPASARTTACSRRPRSLPAPPGLAATHKTALLPAYEPVAAPLPRRSLSPPSRSVETPDENRIL